jgi:hypothetical protein
VDIAHERHRSVRDQSGSRAYQIATTAPFASERKTSAVISTPHVNGSARMKKLFIAMGVSAAALLGGSAANAADNTVKAKAATDVTQSSTDISSRRRYHHYGYRQYRPHYRSYGYAPRPYYGGGYGYGGPSVTFGFGGGGYRGW